MTIYLDNNASTPLAPEVAASCQEELIHLGNPSSVHSAGRDARARLTLARRTISNFLGVTPPEIIFTSGGTESLNLLIGGILGKRRHKGRIITSATEHSCVHDLLAHKESLGWEIITLKPGISGAITLADVEKVVDEETALICLMAANNETGVKNEWEKIAGFAHMRKIPFVVDGVALLGKEPFQIPEGVTGMGFSGHKIHAPKGSGFVYLQSGCPIVPQMIGGAQEGHRRGGTENLVGIIGMAKGVSLLEDMTNISNYLRTLRDDFERRLVEQLPNISINGEGPRISNTSNIAFEGVDGESLLMSLDLQGVLASHGSACSSGSLEPSRILLEMGLPRPRVRSSIRFSFSRFNTPSQIEKATEIIIDTVRRLRAI